MAIKSTPLALDPNDPENFRIDLEILQNERQALERLARDILANKSLAWMIVHAYLQANNFVLLPRDEFYVIPKQGWSIAAAKGEQQDRAG